MEQYFPRVTAPHLESLVDALAPILTGAGYHVDYGSGAVRIDFPDFAGTEAAVQAAVDAAPDDSPARRLQYAADQLATAGGPVGEEVLKQALWAMLALVNRERQRHARPAITPAQFIAAVKERL